MQNWKPLSALPFLLLLGCANLEQTHRSELQAEVESGKGVLVITRDAGLNLDSNIEVDGKSRCQLDEKTFCMLRLPPGRYTVSGSGYFGKDVPKILQRIGLQVTITAQSHTFVMIDSKLDSGYLIPLPRFIAASVTTSTRFFTVDIEKFLALRFLLKKVEPTPMS